MYTFIYKSQNTFYHFVYISRNCDKSNTKMYLDAPSKAGVNFFSSTDICYIGMSCVHCTDNKISYIYIHVYIHSINDFSNRQLSRSGICKYMHVYICIYIYI